MDLGAHGADPLRLDGVRARLGSGDDDVGALEGLFLGVDALRVGGLADLPLAVEGGVGLDVVAALVETALAVEDDHLVRVGPVGQEQPGGRAVGGAGAQKDDLDVLQLLADHLAGR